MTKRIFIWLGHPHTDTLCGAIADAYQRGAEAAGAEVRRLNLMDMDFDPNLAFGYQQQMELEPDLERWRDNIAWADHTAWIYPYWWAGMPAKMKGVIDRAFLPGFAFHYHEKGPWWDKLLVGRTADVLITGNSPGFFDRLMFGAPGRKAVCRLMLEFSGIKTRKVIQWGPVRTGSRPMFESWIRRAEKIGASAAKA